MAGLSACVSDSGSMSDDSDNDCAKKPAASTSDSSVDCDMYVVSAAAAAEAGARALGVPSLDL